MNIIRIACLGVTGVLFGMFLKEMRSPYAVLISLATCTIIIFYSVSKLSGIFGLIDQLEGYAAVQNGYFQILLKIIGITYVADFSASICRDAGYSAIAGQIEIFGKISILAVSSPIILTLLETVKSFW